MDEQSESSEESEEEKPPEEDKEEEEEKKAPTPQEKKRRKGQSPTRFPGGSRPPNSQSPPSEVELGRAGSATPTSRLWPQQTAATSRTARRRATSTARRRRPSSWR